VIENAGMFLLQRAGLWLFLVFVQRAGIWGGWEGDVIIIQVI